MAAKYNLSRSVFIYSAGNFFVKSINFLLLPFYSNVIKTNDYGNYAIVMSFYAITSVFYQAGLSSGFTKFFLQTNDENERKKIFSSSMNFIVISNIILTALLILFSKPISSLVLNDVSSYGLIIAVAILLIVDTCSYFFLLLLKVKEQPFKIITVLSISAVFNLLLNVFFISFLKIGIYGIILSQMISSVLSIFLLVKDVKEYYVFINDKELLKKILKFSLPLILAGLFSAAVDFADRFILNIYHGNRIAGIYSFGYKIALVMNVFVTSFKTAWTPRSLNLYFENKYKDSFGQVLTNLISVSAFLLLAVPIVTELFFTINIFGIYILNPQYKESLNIIWIILVSYFFNGIVTFYSVYPYLQKSSYHLAMADFVGFLLNMLFNFLLIPVYSMYGAAYATLFGFIGSAIYMVSISFNKIKFRYNFKQDSLIIALTILCCIIVNLLNILIIKFLIITVFILILIFILKINPLKLLKFKNDEEN